jgi:hypothetical protein
MLGVDQIFEATLADAVLGGDLRQRDFGGRGHGDDFGPGSRAALLLGVGGSSSGLFVIG